MKVAYLVNCYPRVSHTFIRREIGALERLGVDVQRFSVRRETSELVDEADKRELASTRVILDIGIVRLLLSLLAACVAHPLRSARALGLASRIGLRSDRGVLRHIAYVAEASVLVRWLRASGAQHVHAHFGTNSTTVAMLCRMLGGPPYSFTAHGPEEFDKPQMLGLRDKIERAAFVVGISHFACSQLYRRCGHAHWPKIHVVRCGLDESLLSAEAAPFPERLRMVSVARLNEQKGQLLLVEALARLVAEGMDLELTLVGDGELRAELEQLIARKQLSARVTITGWADARRVRQELDAARLMVLPSFAEGLPVVLMEALAVGRPVVTTYIAGITELVSPSCGWLVPAGSVDALVDGLRSALSAPVDVLERMGRDGQVRVRQQHNADTEALKLRSLFEGAIAPHAATHLAPSLALLAAVAIACVASCSRPQSPSAEGSPVASARAASTVEIVPTAEQAPGAAADQQPVVLPARRLEPPANGAIYDIGPLPPELALRLPSRPFTNNEQVVSTNEQFEKAAAISGTHVIVAAKLHGRLSITGSDIKVTMRDGGELGDLTVEHRCKRVELRGGRYASILLALPAQFAPTEVSHPEWAVEDVIIDGVEVHASGMAFEIYGKRIAIVRSKTFAGTYSIWSGPVMDVGNEDLLIAGNKFRSAGPEATVRLVNATRSVTIDNVFRNDGSYKHNYRVHGPSRLAFAARNTFINSGVMFATGQDDLDKAWFNDNTFFQTAPDLFNVDAGRIHVLSAVGNTAYTDRHRCFWCEPVPDGWRIERNRILPYRKPPPERAPAP